MGTVAERQVAIPAPQGTHVPIDTKYPVLHVVGIGPTMQEIASGAQAKQKFFILIN